MRWSVVAMAAAVIVLVVVVIHFVMTPSQDNLMTAATSSEDTGPIPTPKYLFEHPGMLKEAEQKCHDGSAASSLYCSNVHRAESLRMADQYRSALQSKGAAK